MATNENSRNNYDCLFRPGQIIDQLLILPPGEHEKFPYATGKIKEVYKAVRVPPYARNADEAGQVLALKVFRSLEELLTIGEQAPTTQQNLDYLGNDIRKKFYHEIKQLQLAGENSEHSKWNIATIVDYGQFPREDDTELMWFAEEFIPGKTLGEYLKEAKEGSDRRPLDYAFAMRTFYQVAKALRFLHKGAKGTEGEPLGIVHLDVKPENLIINKDSEKCRVKLTDFGNARLVSDQTYFQLGSILYRSPEQLPNGKGPVPAGKPADMWSFGVMLYESLTGFYPFETSTPDWSTLDGKELEEAKRELVHNIKKYDDFPTPNDFNPDVSDTLNDLVTGLLRKNPDERKEIESTFRSLKGIVANLKG